MLRVFQTFLLVAVFLSGCEQVVKDPNAFISKYHQVSETITKSEGFEFVSMLASAEYLASTKLRGIKGHSAVELDSLVKKYSNYSPTYAISGMNGEPIKARYRTLSSS